MSSKSYPIGVLGHRALGDCGDYDFARLIIQKILKELKVKRDDVKVISAISEGADSLFAEVAISLGIYLETIIPYEGFSDDFSPGESQARYKSIRESSEREVRLSFSKRCAVAYKKSMEWIVFKSSMIIALWDGKEVGTIGGTWEAVSLCRKLKKNLIHIDVMNRRINIYSNCSKKYSLFRDINSARISRYI